MNHEIRHTICTIVAKNYLAYARTLCDSFLEQHPTGKSFVLFIDDIKGHLEPEKEKFEVVSLASIGLPDTSGMCFKYNITELATAAKPFLMSYLLEQYSPGKLLYLDPDILIVDSLTPVFDQLDDCDILLTPHLDTDFPDDCLMPDDAHIMKSGINNLGFIGLRQCENTRGFLAWLQHKLADKCVIDHVKGYFVDQRFVDLALSLFPNIAINGNPAFNVAYWNLHSRRVSHDGKRWLVNGLPMVFYHFSGHKPDRPDEISVYQNRFRLSDMPDLARLFEHYDELLDANSHAVSGAWPYQHDYYSNGKRISGGARKAFRDSGCGTFEGDPFIYGAHARRFRLKALKEQIKILLMALFMRVFR